MPLSASPTTSERSQLLKEIAQLELELARLSDPARGVHQHSAGGGGGKGNVRWMGERRGVKADDESEVVLDRILDAAKNGGDDYARTGDGPEGARGLKRARRTVEENAQLTGVRIDRASAKLVSSNRTSQIRLHTLSGHAHAAPLPAISFKLELHVREPPADPDERYKPGRDPGREYAIEQMEIRVERGSQELQGALQSLQPDNPPNPPAFFALLRQYSLLAAYRSQLFDSFAEALPDLAQGDAEPGQNGSTELTFASQSARSPVLTFSYRIAPSSSPSPILRSARPVEPHLSLAATSLPPGLATGARHALEAIPAQFERMLKDGCEAKAAVEAIVKAVFEGEG